MIFFFKIVQKSPAALIDFLCNIFVTWKIVRITSPVACKKMLVTCPVTINQPVEDVSYLSAKQANISSKMDYAYGFR